MTRIEHHRLPRQFGIHEPVRAHQLSSIKAAAQALLAGKHVFPSSRAAQLLTADDEKRLRGIVKTVAASMKAVKEARTQQSSPEIRTLAASSATRAPSSSPGSGNLMRESTIALLRLSPRGAPRMTRLFVAAAIALVGLTLPDTPQVAPMSAEHSFVTAVEGAR